METEESDTLESQREEVKKRRRQTFPVRKHPVSKIRAEGPIEETRSFPITSDVSIEVGIRPAERVDFRDWVPGREATTER